MAGILSRLQCAALSGLMAVLFSFTSPPARAAMIEDFVSTFPLTSRTDIVLPFEADFALILPDGRLALATARRSGVSGGGSLTVFDPRTGEKGPTIDLVHDVAVVELNAAAGFLYAAGNAGDAFRITRVRLDDRSITAHIQPGAILHPSLAVSDDGTVMLGHRDTNAVSIIPSAQFLPTEKAEAQFAANGEGYGLGLRYNGPGNISGLAASSDGSVLFVSDTNEARLSAIDVRGKQTVVDQLGYADAKDPQSIPLVVQAQGAQTSGAEGAPATHLIAVDARRSRLLLVDYNPAFQTLDPVSEAGFRFAAPLAPDDKSGSPLLVDANASQSVIVLASRTGRSLRAFGRNGSSIEAGPDFADLPESPLSLDVSTDGNLAVLMLSDRKTLSLLRGDSTVAIESQAEAIRALQRQLTELGYPIGVVDGIAGEKTNRALLRALRQLDGSASLPADLKSMSEAQILELANTLKSARELLQNR